MDAVLQQERVHRIDDSSHYKGQTDDTHPGHDALHILEHGFPAQEVIEGTTDADGDECDHQYVLKHSPHVHLYTRAGQPVDKQRRQEGSQ